MRRTAITVIACLAAFAATAAPAFARRPTACSPRSPTASSSRSTRTAAACGRSGRAAAGDISGLAWSPDGNKLAFSYGGRLVVYDLPTRERHADGPAGRRDATSTPTWSADGARDRVPAHRRAQSQETDQRADLDGSDLQPRRRSNARPTASPGRRTSPTCGHHGRAGGCTRVRASGRSSSPAASSAPRPGRRTASGVAYVDRGRRPARRPACASTTRTDGIGAAATA